MPNYLFAQSKKENRVVKPIASMGIRFTENLGQWEPNILAKARLGGGALFIEKNCLTFNFFDREKFRSLHGLPYDKNNPGKYGFNYHAYKIHFNHCNLNPEFIKEKKETYYENYFIGKDQSKWKGNVGCYNTVWLKNIYPGIDYEMDVKEAGIKYNFHVKAGADVNKIQMRYEGVEKINIRNGVLVIGLDFKDVIENKPFAFQNINGELKPVKCNFRLDGRVVSFDFPDGYNENEDLIIDPILVFSAQAGATADNFGMTATFDDLGNLYSGGTVFDVGYPFVLGITNIFNGPPAYGNTDIFITKYNSIGNSLIYSTYLGGNRTEVVSSLIVDNNNNLCLYGATGSANFPVTAGCAYPAFAGGTNIGFISNGSVFYDGTDIYIAKLNANGNSLLGCTYYGGSGNDGVNYQPTTYTTSFALLPAPGTATTNTSDYNTLVSNYGDTYRGEIQVDNSNNIYIVSSTRSSNLPMVNAIDGSLGGVQDAVVAKFNSNLTSLIYSTYLGGSLMECGNGMFVRPNEEVYVTGGTTSADFPGTAGGEAAAFQGGVCDGFLTKINPAGNAILQSTYIGTSSYDNSFFVSCNVAGDPHVFGQSLGNMPIVGAPIYSVALTHQFITKYNQTLTSKIFSTVFGSNTSNFDISPSAFAVDECDGSIYLSGWGGNILTQVPIGGMPLLNPTQGTTTGFDFYLMALGPNANSLVYGSYYGGASSQEHVDGGTSRFDRRGVIYQSVCAGCGGNQDFPHTPFTWPCPNQQNCPNPNPSPNCNNGVFKLDFEQNTVATINQNTVTGCVPLVVTFTNVTPGTGFIWHFGNGQTNSVTPNPTFTYTQPGTYTVSLVVYDVTKCVQKDSTTSLVVVIPGPDVAFNASLSPCTNTVTFVNNSTGTLIVNPFIWNLGDGSPTQTINAPAPHVYTTTGTYTITLTTLGANGCSATAVQTVNIFNFNPSVNSANLCLGSSINLLASGGTSYTWSPPENVSNPNVAGPTVNPTVTTIYTIQIENNSQGYVCSKTLTTEVKVFPKPNASFAYTMNPCGGGVNFIDGSVANISSWDWTLTVNATSTVQNPYYFYSNGGTHSVILVVTNSDGCKDTMTDVIQVAVPPPLSINANSLICLGSSAQLNASGGIGYTWTPSATLNNANIANPIASPSVSTQYSVLITTSNSCTFMLMTNVGVSFPSSVQVSASANPTFVIVGNTTTLIYTGAPGANVGWLPVGSTTPAVGYTVTVAPVKPTTYTAVAGYGACTEQATVAVDAFTEGCIEKDVFVPNTFTPNGDGQNDVLFVRGLKVDEVYFAVYNRWGEMVFETKEKNKGWDGIYKGRPADVGVFGWYLKVKCFNGEETFRKGNVTLIR
ncbi:MAG: gliding motility-associated C-terminal domain-containing protein [Sphingobacteriaceae bacterium]|nr:gliding motility-associated C-terminal domain-containing protein [Sphingobacteriaceae bacterium]